MNLGLVEERVTKRGEGTQALRLTPIYGAERQVVIDAYDTRRDIEDYGSLGQVLRFKQLKTSLYDFLKSAHSVAKDSCANKGVELDLSEEIGELSQMLLAEFPLMKKPLAEFEAKNYLWHLRNC